MKIPRGYDIHNSCICKDKKSMTTFEIENKTHEKSLCVNCVNLFKSLSTVKIISEVPIPQ